jgi:hypothetical protein
MSPSQFEIEREVETLRDIRRRSSVPGLVIDPDLPSTSAHHHGSDDEYDHDHPDEVDPDTILASPGADDPSSLFWVPARLHPEIAPSEFKAFLKEHARVAADGTATGGLSRVGSVSSLGGGGFGGLGRKRSMLHKEYDPSSSSGTDDDHVVPIRRNRTSMYQNMPQLTISDLQKLEELAESDDPTKLQSLLRRSMSLSMSPSGS